MLHFFCISEMLLFGDLSRGKALSYHGIAPGWILGDGRNVDPPVDPADIVKHV